jgi:hypothetical protein
MAAAMGALGSYSALLQGFTWAEAWTVFLAVLPAWLFGALVGYLVSAPPTRRAVPRPSGGH